MKAFFRQFLPPKRPVSFTHIPSEERAAEKLNNGLLYIPMGGLILALSLIGLIGSTMSGAAIGVALCGAAALVSGAMVAKGLHSTYEGWQENSRIQAYKKNHPFHERDMEYQEQMNDAIKNIAKQVTKDLKREGSVKFLPFSIGKFVSQRELRDLIRQELVVTVNHRHNNPDNEKSLADIPVASRFRFNGTADTVVKAIKEEIGAEPGWFSPKKLTEKIRNGLYREEDTQRIFEPAVVRPFRSPLERQNARRHLPRYELPVEVG